MVQCLWWPFLCAHTVGQPVEGHVYVASSNFPDATDTNKYKYVFRAVGCFPGPYLGNRLPEVHIN